MTAFLAAWVLACVCLSAQETFSQDVKERRRVPRTLAKQGSSAIPQLEKLLADPDLEVRVESVKALVEIGTQHSLAPLVQATRDADPEIQIRATDGLVNFYLPGYVRTGLSATLRRAGGRLAARFTDTNDQVIDPWMEIRPDVGAALGRLARGGSAPESRANAARAAGILRARPAVPDLLEAIRSKDTQVIYESLVAFQKIGDRSVAPRLEFLLRISDERIQVAALETAGLLYNLEALPVLRSVLSRTNNRRVRRAALTAIAMLPDPGNRPVLLPYLQDRDNELRAAAAEGLGRIKDPSDVAALERRYEEEGNNLARLSAAFALVSCGKHEVSEFSPFQYVVNSLNNASRASAARALLTELARDARLRGLLHQALRQGTRDEKVGLLQVLAASGDAESLRAMEPLARDPDLTVASEAVRAMRALRARLP
ncbi:MAG: HEAT repeat domain-containing protein [Bryobacterales bacterium]|nr:HEAT repeat domain-containing protein [Bryobacterales bacterium]